MALLLTLPMLAGVETARATPADLEGSFEPGPGIRMRVTNTYDGVVVVEGLQMLSIAGGLVLLGRDEGWQPGTLEPGESALRVIGLLGMGVVSVTAIISYAYRGEQLQVTIAGRLMVLGPFTLPLD